MNRSFICTHRAVGIFALLLALIFPVPCFAYIGPGAGFAFLGSGAVFVLTICMAVVTIALWPLQFVWRLVSDLLYRRKARVKRVVILGLDGLDPKLIEKYMEEGRLPNFSALRDQGSYRRLATTLPALSPVAWSTFQTGVNPGAHNIFDFLSRDKRFCLPELSAVKTETTTSHWKLGPIKIPRRRTEIKLMRKSQPFWKLLGSHQVPANVLRVPISYPPEKFRGNILSAMCTPDLRGTQGTFTLFTSEAVVSSSKGGESTGGENKIFTIEGGTYKGEIEGPPDPGKSGSNLTVPFELSMQGNRPHITVQGQAYDLNQNQFSNWIPLEFSVGRRKICGIVRVCLRETGPNVVLYVSPVNVDPNDPVLPISSPLIFSTWLAKRQGRFGTLGLLEDTWGRNERALDDRRFLDQAYLAHEERKVMFFETLKRTREGVCICVFDASDRIQHMFWRYLDPQHPSPCEDVATFGAAIPEMYQRMDALVGDTLKEIGEDDILMVLSDHGFSSFRRCINLNTWLYENGYLHIKGSAVTGVDYLQEVDWSRTKAFALGLAGIYINRKGRERSGIVEAREAEQIKQEIISKLEQIRDPLDDAQAVKKVHDTKKAYKGLYTDEAPDLIVGYAPGYRVSWDSVTGTIEPTVFADNTKAWSGDHHIDPSEVPGILFVNRPLRVEQAHIADIAPTTLDLFGVTVPGYMEGKVLV